MTSSLDVKNATWVKINDFLLVCGSARNLKSFIEKTVESLSTLVPFDQSKVYLYKQNGKVYDEILYDADEYWSKQYLEYYIESADEWHSPDVFPPSAVSTFGDLTWYRWKNAPVNEFVADFVLPQGLNYSLGFGLYDAEGFVRCSCSLDRTREADFTEEDLLVLSIVYPHLENLFRNFFIGAPLREEGQREGSESSLTPRETEIADLLRRGVTPDKISGALNLNRKTVYRHMANIHKKLHVSNRQELIIKLLESG